MKINGRLSLRLGNPGHSGPDASRIGRAAEHKQPGQFVPGSSREATAVALCVATDLAAVSDDG
ncbi:hypothetical protein EYF80_026799 [Liparis tanakae]|uniref:Uncharacterized protein n=1 Tax=Liparis tanakae TaxID=230148 RepID=A0A4Z2HBU0_9TELE|nr:hypothetical protein EYF80_026799 [Liparis tanakae]